MLKFLITLFYIGVASSTIAQSTAKSQEPDLIEVQGFLFSSLDSTPIPFAHIHLSHPDTLFWVISDFKGTFIMQLLESEKYTLEISALGYESRTTSIDVNQKKAISISLNEIAILAGEVLVKSKRTSKTITKSPSRITVLDKKSIESSYIQSFDQALENINGLTVTRSGGANVQAVSIRGASEVAGGGTGNRILLLIDGRPALSPDSGGALWNLVPMSTIERIEVVKGAASSLYGSSAMGGVINVITKKPGTTPQTQASYSYGFYESPSITAEYNVFNDFHQLLGSHDGTKGRFSYLFDGAYLKNDGHREKSAFQSTNFYSKLNWDFLAKGNVSISGNYNTIFNDTPATWLSARQAYSVADFRKDDYQRKKEFSSDIHYSVIPDEQNKFSSRLFYYTNYSSFSFNDDPGNDSTNVNTGTSQIIDSSSIYTYRIGNITQWDVNKGRHYFIMGFEPSFDLVDAKPDTVLYGRHHVFNTGIYIQDEYLIKNHTELTMGLRYDYYNIFESFQESNWSPKIALKHTSNPRLTFIGTWAQAYRNPAIAERYIKFEQGGGLRFEPNPNLVSEKLYFSLDLGVHYRPLSKLSLSLNLYRNLYRGLISFEQISKAGDLLTFRVINLKKALMQGVEFDLGYKPNSFYALHLHYHFLDAKDLSEERYNDVLAYKVRHQFFINNQFNYKNLSLQVNGRFRSRVEEVFIYPGNEPESNFLINTKLNIRVKEKLRWFMAISNLTNVQYEELERYRMPGRSYSTGLKIIL